VPNQQRVHAVPCAEHVLCRRRPHERARVCLCRGLRTLAGCGGSGRAWEGRWSLYKDPHRPPAPLVPPSAERVRGFSYISAFPARRAQTPALRGGREKGQSYFQVFCMYYWDSHTHGLMKQRYHARARAEGEREKLYSGIFHNIYRNFPSRGSRAAPAHCALRVRSLKI